MKKITLLVSEKEREKFISRLRKAGVIHVKHVIAPVAHEINFVEDRISKIEKTIATLSPFAQEEKEDPRASDHERDVLSCANAVEDALKEKIESQEQVEEIKKRLLWFDAWGGFDPKDIETLKDKGASIRLYCLKKKEFKEVKKNPGCYVVGKARGYIYLAQVAMAGEEKLLFEEMIPPPEGPVAMGEELEKLSERIAQIDKLFTEKARTLEAIKKCKRKLDREHESLAVRFGMQKETQFAYLQGFCPEKRVEKMVSMAKKHGLGYLIEEPDEPEETPTLITNPAWIRIISPVFRFMNTLPGYSEFDISFFFLVFFSLFFAMLIGDAGYGLLFLVVTFLARRKFKKAPREPFFLMYLLSCATIVWGAATGTWFGAEKIAELPFLNVLIVQKISSFAGNNQNFMMYICFLIGAVQLTLAHLMKAFRVINSVRALAQAGWVMILWGMFFAAGKFVLGRAFPPYAGWLLISGVVLVLFFSNPQRGFKGFCKGTLVTLASLPLSVIGSFSDIVSYLRLFAVGYATVVVAESFNNMALAGGVGSVIGGLTAAIILFLGHTLNILLGFMAVIVHGIRLNMLEFSSHLGMQWSGKEYEPFCEK
ncbi:V-type ATP synthase subunit I [Candidatus Omnitrophota bacterium]